MRSFAFQREQRLLKASDYKFVFDSVDGRFSHKGFLILARKAPSQSIGRLGLIVAKKHLRRAVDRNHFKRIVRDNFRLNQNRLQGLDFIVLARPAARDMSNVELRQALELGWEKLLKRRYFTEKDAKTLANSP